MTPSVVAIFGPTASGKSSLALAVAERAGGEIVSCDSMQVYDGLPILTNQPTAADLATVPHHLVAVWPLSHDGDVAQYQELAHRAIDDIVGRGRLAVVVGGTGLYLQAALGGLDLPPRVPPEVRIRAALGYDRDGPVATHATLARLDPRAAAAIHPNDRRRVVRALELVDSGASLAPREGGGLFAWHPRHESVVIGLVRPRSDIRDRIARRTAAMFDAGVVDEVRTALASIVPSSTAEQALGLDDLAACARGEMTAEMCRDRLIVRTRQYARRQDTWLRRLPTVLRVAAGEKDDLTEQVFRKLF